jgi:dCMP deaminase
MADEKDQAPPSEADVKAARLKYCMKLACLTASRSKCTTKVGAVIIRGDPQVISTGFYHFIQEPPDEASREYYECHAEMNALVQSSVADVKGCTMFVTAFPCSNCFSHAIEAGITDIIYLTGPETKNGEIIPECRATEFLMTSLSVNYRICRSFRDELMGITKKSSTAWPPPKFEIKFEDVQDTPGDLTQDEEDDHYFMGVAFLAAKRSYVHQTKVGACIVDKDRKIVSVDCNALPVGSEGIVTKKSGRYEKSDKDWIISKYPYAINSMAMTVLNRHTANLKGCTVYLTNYPDHDGAKVILLSGVSDVCYLTNVRANERQWQAAKKMLEEYEGETRPPTGRPSVREFQTKQYVIFNLLDETDIKISDKNNSLVTQMSKMTDSS